MNKYLGLLFFILLAVFLSASASAGNKLNFVFEFEGGKLYRAGAINVPVMKGSFYQMGRQYGGLLKAELAEFYDMAVTGDILGKMKAPYKDVLDASKQALEREPFYVKEWIRGMSETSGLGTDKHIILNEALGILLMGPTGCSGMIAWKDYSKGGSPVVGRNWDLGTMVLIPYQKFLTVNVFNPSGSSHSVADINYIASTMWQSGMNDAGLFYDLQNGSMSDPNAAKNRLNSNCALMSMLLDYGSLEQAEAFFDAVRAEGGLIINVADSKRACSFEWGTFDYRKRIDDEKGILASSNDWLDPTWNVTRALPDGAPAGFTKERRCNLLSQGKKNRGSIDANKMMEIFDKNIPEGGPSFHKDSGLKTYYTIVAVPKDLKIWLNVRDLQGWTEIDLKPFISGNSSMP